MVRLAAEAVKASANNAERLRETTGWFGAYRHGESVPTRSRRCHFLTRRHHRRQPQLNRMMPIRQIHVLRLQISLRRVARRAQMRVTRNDARGPRRNAALPSGRCANIRRSRARYAELPEEAFLSAELISEATIMGAADGNRRLLVDGA
jgi:hypothetical protein